MTDPRPDQPNRPAQGDGDDGEQVVPLRRRRQACPTCGKPPAERYRPFCSKRCADVDLNRWLTGRYAVPIDEPADPDADPSGGREEPE